ncbi:MAG: hypothetical protein ACW96U_13575 [Candidatus Heimdallarchaeaceae archaeon]|jgi:hypothetical protein
MALVDEILVIFNSLYDIVNQGYTYFYIQASSIIGEVYLQLLLLTVGMFVYAIFVWYFYRSLSKRDLFKLDLEKYRFSTAKHKTLQKAGDVIIYLLKYGLIFPVLIAVWFLMLSFFLLVLTKGMAVDQILMVSIIVVSASRIASYYKEDLAADLAKLIPLAILAIMISNPNFFVVETAVSRLLEIPNVGSQIINFLIFSIVLEWSLRSLYLVKLGINSLREKS